MDNGCGDEQQSNAEYERYNAIVEATHSIRPGRTA
jgi:hypothetical protein